MPRTGAEAPNPAAEVGGGGTGGAGGGRKWRRQLRVGTLVGYFHEPMVLDGFKGKGRDFGFVGRVAW